MISESTFETYLTITGQVILNKLLAGQNIQITRAVLSSQTTETPEELTAMNPESISTSQITLTEHGDYTDIELAFDFTTLENDLYFRSLGIYGKTGNSEEKLIFVSLVNENNQLVIPAHSPITYIISVKETFAVGHLEVYISPDYATPISHHSDFTRHIFSQTNNSASLVLVNSGVAETFANNDSILFIPKANVNHGATIRIASKDYTLTYKNIQGTTINTGVFKAHRPYVLYFNNNTFIYKEPEINVTNGALTYWNGSTFKTVQDPTDINTLFRVQNGILHYYNNGAWHSTMQAGIIYAFARSSSLNGYLLCDGSTLNKNDYPELYAVIGHYYGGTGDNFKVPDLRGRTIIGVNSSHLLGTTGGQEERTLIEANIPSHNHKITIKNIKYNRHKYGGNESIGNTNPDMGGGNPNTGWFNIVPSTGTLIPSQKSVPGFPLLNANYADQLKEFTTSGSGTTTNKGNSQPFGIMQPYMAINYYISTGRSLIS